MHCDTIPRCNRYNRDLVAAVGLDMSNELFALLCWVRDRLAGSDWRSGCLDANCCSVWCNKTAARLLAQLQIGVRRH